MSERRTWNWRSQLTPDEEREVAKYDAAMKKVRAAQIEADEHRLAFQRIQNRAQQRAKYKAGAR